MNNIYQINHTIELLHDSDHFYMICFNLQGQYTYANKSYTNKFSPNGDLLSLKIENILHPADMQIGREVGAKCKEMPGTFFPSVIRKIDRNGCHVKTQWENVLMMQESGPIGYFALGYDITEFENIKGEVITINQDLQVKNQKLQSIAYEQSHTLRGPVANILGLLNIMKTLQLNPDARSVVTMLDDSTKQLDEIIKGIVDTIYA
jgi:signal transduction histidine kinase